MKMIITIGFGLLSAGLANAQGDVVTPTVASPARVVQSSNPGYEFITSFGGQQLNWGAYGENNRRVYFTRGSCVAEGDTLRLTFSVASVGLQNGLVNIAVAVANGNTDQTLVAFETADVKDGALQYVVPLSADIKSRLKGFTPSIAVKTNVKLPKQFSHNTVLFTDCTINL